MTKYYAAKIQLNDSKTPEKRRFRTILAASGKILESGEIRDIEHLFVMGRDSKLYPVHALAKDPAKQTEEYIVQAQINHGDYDDGELVPNVENVFGECKVWLEDDGLKAQMYFDDDDKLADHCWAISKHASYSTGIDWYPDGYYGAGNNISEPIGILREISMVVTGNDPRAKTIDTKTSKGSDGTAVGDKKFKKGNIMNGTRKSIDALTPDERDAMGRELLGVLDKFTTDAPESETEPTAKDTQDKAEPEENGGDKKTDTAETTAPTTTTTEPAGSSKDTLHMPIVVIKDSQEKANQETTGTKRTNDDWRFTKEAKRRFADLLHQHGDTRGAFASEWMAELRSHASTTNDGITGLGLPVDGERIFINAIEKADGLLSHVSFRNIKSLHTDLLRAVGADTGAETARAHGFKKGDEKMFQELITNGRNIYTKMIYKMLDLDATEIYENPELIDVRSKELVESLLVEYERAFVIGDGRTAPTGDAADLRVYDGTRGIRSILLDAQATAGGDDIGQFFAKSITLPSTANLFDASIEAESEIDANGGLIWVIKKDAIKNFRKATDADGRLLVPMGTTMEQALQAERVYAPNWMKYSSVDAIVFANKSYTMIGEQSPNMKPSFDVRKNQDILLVEQHRGGALTERNAAVAITFSPSASASE